MINNRLLIFLVLTLLVSIQTLTIVYGNSEVINENLEIYNFEEVDSVLINEDGLNLSLKTIVKDIISGELNLSISEIFEYLFNILIDEYKTIAFVFFDLFILGIASAFIQNLTYSVKPKATSAIGGYVCYIALIHILVTTLSNIMGITSQFLNFIENFTMSITPIVLGLLAFSGYLGTLYFVQPIIIFLTYIISFLFRNILIQFIFIIAIIEILNGVTSKDLLSSFCDLGNKIIKWSLKTLTLVYMGVLSLVKIGAPISDNLIKKGTKTIVSAVPVVGNTLESAVDTVEIVASVSSSAIMFGIVLLVFLYGLGYLVKLVIYNFLFLVICIFLEPIAEKNIVKAIKSLSKYIEYLISIVGISIFLLVFSVIMILS